MFCTVCYVMLEKPFLNLKLILADVHSRPVLLMAKPDTNVSRYLRL